MRPIGGLLFGTLGDKYGRKCALTLSLPMMAIPTACIGLLPTYASIGIWAPMLLACVPLALTLRLALPRYWPDRSIEQMEIARLKAQLAKTRTERDI
jgi:MFS family permease